MKKIFIISLLALLPLLTSAQDTAKKKAYFFYGDQCPHCKKVEAFFQANGIYDKYDITSLEFSNPFNGRLLLKFGDAFDDSNKGGVPAMAFADKFIVGDQPIIDNFEKEIDAADASSLPDPDKISKNTATENPTSADIPAPTGNKKSYFPVIIVTLVIVGGAALFYINRKKSNK